MNFFRRFWFPFPVLLPVLLSAMLVACSGSAGRSAAERPDDMAMGNPKAKVVIYEYASLTCPHCADFHKEIFPKLKAKYIDTGMVRFVFRQFPTAPVPYAVGAEAVARCAGPGKYFDLLDALYDRQGYWIRSNNPRQALMEIAATAGITQNQFDTCVGDEANVKRIQEVAKIAQNDFKITGTPSFVINGKLRPKVRTMESFEAILDPLLGIKSPAKKPAADEAEKAETGVTQPAKPASGETGDQ